MPPTDKNNKVYYAGAAAAIFFGLFTIIAVVAGLRLIGGEDGWICVEGKWIRHGHPAGSAPIEGCGAKNPEGNNETPAARNGETEQAEANIVIISPAAGETIGDPVIIRGRARVFENTFTYRIKDAAGNTLAENSAMTDAPDAGIFGNFQVSAEYAVPASENGTIEVFEYSARDGSEINKAGVPVRFGKIETMEIRAYFGNSVNNPNAEDCDKVFPVVRTIPKTEAPARAALKELLSGPTAGERSEGYYTSLNAGVNIQKLSIEDGTAKVDFNEQLQAGVGGSCRVAAIRAEITETLKQFFSVKDVIISIDGRIEDILQP